MKLNKLLIAVSIATFALASCESEFTKDAELNVNVATGDGVSFDGQTITVTVKNGAVCVTDGGENPWKLTHREIHELLLSPFALDLQERAPRGWFPLPWHTPVADTF